jgi:hypothetical protein
VEYQSGGRRISTPSPTQSAPLDVLVTQSTDSAALGLDLASNGWAVQCLPSCVSSATLAIATRYGASCDRRRIEEQFAVIDRAADTVQTMFRRAHSCRSAIFAAAFSGKLVPQDPNDQPASTLLGRIANDRTSSNSHKPTRTRKPRTKVTA